MGKKKTKRFGALRPNPTSMLSDRELELQFDLNSVAASQNAPLSVASIIEKLQAPSTEERACGCQLLASLVSQPRSIDFLLKENIVKIAAPLFLDPSLEVQRSALGAMRNMSVYGNQNVCDEMMASDIMTPLTALIKQYDKWIPQNSEPKDRNSTNVLVETFELLSNLCEGSSTAVTTFNKEDLLPTLLPLLKNEDYGYPLAIAVARCLHIVSENNTAVSGVLLEASTQSMLFDLVSIQPSGVDTVLLRTFVIGILLNLSDVDLSAHYKGIVKALADVIDMDSLPLVITALDRTEETPETSGADSLGTWPDVSRLIQAQGICLELIANMCCSEDEWEEMECESSEESSDDQARVTDGDACGMGSSLCLPSEIHTAFMESEVLSKILKKAHPLDASQTAELQKSQAGKNALERLTDLQSRALLCLSNLLSALDEASLTQSTLSLTSVWADLYKLAQLTQDHLSLNEDYKWSVTSAMRAVLQRISEGNSAQLGDVSESDINFLVSFGAGTKNRESQVNVVRIVSTVGCVLSVQVPPHPLLVKIGCVLLEVAATNEDLVVIAEALDSIFDVFKEDHTDPVVRDIGLINKLRALQPSFKARVSSQRKKLGENYSVVAMAKENLAGYIKYKISQG